MAKLAKLATYRKKRDFGVTAEPSGDAPAGAHAGRGYVIQKHAARRLHYDFRLEHDGVLWSWSVPKGPSLQPKDRRLAVRTEDHPLAYADFEGIIPAGQYGGGTVVVWDRGTWEPEGDAGEAMAKGRLTFTLHGEKLHGRWHLVKTRPEGKQEQWLLFKGRDEEARDDAAAADIVGAKPASVITGRTVEEVAADADRVWQSNRAEKVAPRTPRRARGTPAAAPADTAAILAQLPLGFRLTSLDKVLYPAQGLTKAQLLGYLAVAAERMLPHVAGRPLTLVRCPHGQGKPCFFQKHLGAGTPKPVGKLPIARVARGARRAGVIGSDLGGEDEPYMVIHDLPGLVALGQMGALEIHTWGSHQEDLEHPDLVVFDLDPDVGLPWDRVALAALDVKKRLAAVGLEAFVKTTGGKGLHVCVPIRATKELDWDGVKAWTKQFAEQMEADAPRAYTSVITKAKRTDKIFVDYLRNGRNATFIAPYSPRARPGAPVAVPITWEELAAGVDPTSFTLTTVPARLARTPDPWAAYAEVQLRQTLPRAGAARAGRKRSARAA